MNNSEITTIYSNNGISSFIMAIIAFFGCFLNGLIFYIYHLKPKIRKRYMLHLNLALFNSIGSMGYFFDVYYLHNKIVMPKPFCQIHAFIISTLAVGSIHQLTLLSLERFVNIKYPFYGRNVTSNQKMLASFIFFCFTILTTLPPVLGWSEYKIMHPQLYYCGFDYLSKEFLTRSYIIYLFISAYVIPLIVIIYVNVEMLCTTHEVIKNNTLSRTKSFQSKTTNNSNQNVPLTEITNDVDKTRIAKYKASQRKAAKTVLFCIISFVISWTPYAISSIGYNLIFEKDSLDISFVIYTALLGKMSVVTNAIIYCLLDKVFQLQLINWLQKKCNIQGGNQMSVQSETTLL